MLRALLSVILLCALLLTAATSPHALADSGTSRHQLQTEATLGVESTALPDEGDEKQEATPTSGVPTSPPLVPTALPELISTPPASVPSATPEATSTMGTLGSPTPEPSPGTKPSATEDSKVAPTSEPDGEGLESDSTPAPPTPVPTGAPEAQQEDRSRPVLEQASDVLPSVVEPEEERTPLERVRDVLLLLNFL